MMAVSPSLAEKVMLAFVLWLPTIGKLVRVIAILAQRYVEGSGRDLMRLNGKRHVAKRNLSSEFEGGDRFYDRKSMILMNLMYYDVYVPLRMKHETSFRL